MMPSSKMKVIDQLTNDGLLMSPQCFTENAEAYENYNYEEIAKIIVEEVLFILGKKDTLITENMAKKCYCKYKW